MTIYVGVIFPPDNELMVIGPDHVGVPSYFWKVAIEADGSVYGAWLFPNEAGKNKSPKAYAISLDRLEKMIGQKLKRNRYDEHLESPEH